MNTQIGDETDEVLHSEMVVESLRRLGWMSPDEVSDMKRRLVDCGVLKGKLESPPRGETINNCPHCGAPAMLIRDPEDDGSSWYFVRCASCHTRTVSSRDPVSVLIIWNKRSQNGQEDAANTKGDEEV